MKNLKCIISKIKKFNQDLNNNDGITWMEYKRQWFLENDTWNCEK